MKAIPLTQGKVALVDDEDYELLNENKWYFANLHEKHYAARCIQSPVTKRKTTIYMHRVILNCKKGEGVDHVSGDGLDNQKANLRKASQALNTRNRLQGKNNKTGFKGVSVWHNKGRWRKFLSATAVGNKKVFIGYFATAREAALAYDRVVAKIHGSFAKTNKQLGLL